MEKYHELTPPIPITVVCQKLTKQTVGAADRLYSLDVS